MEQVIDRLDESGKGAWIVAMILGFIVFWPIGLAILFYLIGSGRMGHWKHADSKCWQSGEFWTNGDGRRSERRRRRQHRRSYHYSPSSGNRAFDAYREETLKRLEEEQTEFHDFLERLRHAKDKQEFDQFMSERGTDGETEPDTSDNQPPKE